MSAESQLLTVGVEAAGLRLDSFVASHLKETSRTRVQRAIVDGDILVNERVVKPSYRLRDGDQVEIDLPEPPPVELIPEPIDLNIVYEDDDLIVVNKPAGMVVHPGAGIDTGTLAHGLVFEIWSDRSDERLQRNHPDFVRPRIGDCVLRASDCFD